MFENLKQFFHLKLKKYKPFWTIENGKKINTADELDEMGIPVQEWVTFFEKNNKTLCMPLFVAFIYLTKLFLSIYTVRFA